MIGGAVVCLFAALGEVFHPKSFAGLFGAAPSVALASLAISVYRDGGVFAAAEARSMIAGAVAFFVYAWFCTRALMGRKHPALTVTLMMLPAWFAVAFAIWFAARFVA